MPFSVFGKSHPREALLGQTERRPGLESTGPSTHRAAGLVPTPDTVLTRPRLLLVEHPVGQTWLCRAPSTQGRDSASTGTVSAEFQVQRHLHRCFTSKCSLWVRDASAPHLMSGPRSPCRHESARLQGWTGAQGRLEGWLGAEVQFHTHSEIGRECLSHLLKSYRSETAGRSNNRRCPRRLAVALAAGSGSADVAGLQPALVARRTPQGPVGLPESVCQHRELASMAQ